MKQPLPVEFQNEPEYTEYLKTTDNPNTQDYIFFKFEYKMKMESIQRDVAYVKYTERNIEYFLVNPNYLIIFQWFFKYLQKQPKPLYGSKPKSINMKCLFNYGDFHYRIMDELCREKMNKETLKNIFDVIIEYRQILEN